ncbi:hypothetical protein MTP99_015717 [Tenebrio molitor]|jgi:hypothetical protein|nr:hypothetical protein MTP99_015717 [Tenebrio molitor]
MAVAKGQDRGQLGVLLDILPDYTGRLLALSCFLAVLSWIYEPVIFRKLQAGNSWARIYCIAVPPDPLIRLSTAASPSTH